MSPISDQHVPGLAALIDYLETNYSRFTDDAINNNYYNITENLNTMTKQEPLNHHTHQSIPQTYYTQHRHTTYTYTCNTISHITM